MESLHKHHPLLQGHCFLFLLSLVMVPVLPYMWQCPDWFGHMSGLLTGWNAYSQDTSLSSQYSLDFDELLRIRQANMAKYPFNFSRTGIDRRSALSLAEFKDVYDGKWPVIISDTVSSWKAFNWTPDFLLSSYGQEKVAIKAVHKDLDKTIAAALLSSMHGSSVSDLSEVLSENDQGHLAKAVSLTLPLHRFYKHIHEASPHRWTYLADELFIPSRSDLMTQIGTPIYVEDDMFRLFPQSIRPWNAMLLWGSAFSRSSLHIDPYNWTGTNAVIYGRKRWKMYPPGQDGYFNVEADQRSGFPLDCIKYNSRIDAFNAGDTSGKWKLPEAVLEFDQHPGEFLIIPTGWFHQAFNVEETLAISGQVMNSNNHRVVLEEIIKAGSLQRADLPKGIDEMPPRKQVQTVLALLPAHILRRGQAVTDTFRH